MEDFTSPNLQLVLGVKEGTNFDRVQKPTVIIATLNNHSLESKKIQPESSPQYETDLVWETDKNALRKMRCNQTPIKVECYAVNDNGSREKLGYILLSVRCAQIIHRGEESKIKTNWHNILGVRNEFNNCKPRLLLYLIIKERESKTINTALKNEGLHQFTTISPNIIPCWSQEENLIQLGPLETCNDIFLLYITAHTVTNLHQLMQEFKENGYSNNFNLVYNILNTTIRLKPFTLESDNIHLNERMCIKLRSSLSVLMSYFNTKSHFFVKLKTSNVTLSQAEINLKSLISTHSTQEFKQINKNSISVTDHYCILKNIQSQESKGDEIHKGPGIKLNIKLQYIDSKEILNEKNSYFHCSPRLQSTQSNVNPLLIEHDCSEGLTISNKYLALNQYSIEKGDKYDTKMLSTLPWEKVVHFNNGPQIHKTKSSIKNSSHQDKESNTESIVAHRSYCLSIELNAIKFFDSKPDVKNVEFRFYHPQGEIITAVCNKISIEEGEIVKLQDVKCKLHFISTSDTIEKLLETFAPKINVCDATATERKCIAQIHLDMKQLFCNKKLEYQYKSPLIDCHSGKEIGEIEIALVLDDHTMSTLNKIKEGNSGTITLDNSLAYKIVDELETWKERQKEMFKEELRKKEQAHLTLLNEEWQRRRQCLESKLACSVQQCKILANDLNKTTENLRARKIQSLEKETKLIQANEELQWKYDRKLHQLQETLQKMQEEFSIKLMTLEEQNQNLMSQIESLNKKKHELERIKTDQAEKLEVYNKASLTQDQTASVLQQLKNLEEKLDNAQKSKSFFKEEWGKAVKEIHRIKMENQQALQSQIKSSKEELNNLDLEEILHADSAALTYDQIALNEIQREIDIMNPDTTLQYVKADASEQLFAPQSDLSFKFDHNFLKSDILTNSSASERKLNILIEERDALLKTGRYTSNDDIIIKLNTEIKSVLINS